MAEIELPWFKFNPDRHLNGNIQYCSLEAQGLYGNIKAFYWKRKCRMTKPELLRKYNHPVLIDELIKEDVIKLDGEAVMIEFLLDLWDELYVSKKASSDFGKKGQEVLKAKRRLQANQSELPLEEVKPTEIKKSVQVGKFFKIGIHTHLGVVSEWANENMQKHMEEVIMKNHPIRIAQVLKEMDDTYSNGYEFTGNNHVRNMFKKIAELLKEGKLTGSNNTASVATKAKAPNVDK